MSNPRKMLGPPLLICVSLVALQGGAEAQSARQSIDGFSIDRSEVTISDFLRFAEATRHTTEAEHKGGGFEFVGGWTRREGWTFRTPFGTDAEGDEPAVHVTWQEAEDYCRWAGGRLPTFEEWAAAAYAETRAQPSEGFSTGTIYEYPVGDTPEGMNTDMDDPWPVHASAGSTKPGVNGLFDMGGNVWEWLRDRDAAQALTAGGSWWYGPEKSKRGAAQWKPADFYAVYIGFRCAYDG